MKRRSFTTTALALAATPFAARAQAPGRTYRIALWHINRPPAELAADTSSPWSALFAELRRLGFVEGRNLVIDRYASEGVTERYEPTAQQIVATRPDAIVANGVIGSRLLQKFSATIPIVGAALPDPISTGLVQSLARPGGNVTGFTTDGGFEIEGLRLQLLKEIVPVARRLAYFATIAYLDDESQRIVRQAAERLNVQLTFERFDDRVLTEASYRSAFARSMDQGAAGILLAPGSAHSANGRLIASLAEATRLPVVSAAREITEAGCLMSYGADFFDNYRKSAGYVARILNGERPGDLPIQQPTIFEFVVNLKTARAIGITVPESIMIRATEVIE